MLSNWLMSLGLTRDSGVWFWTRLTVVLGLIATGAIDVAGISEWLGWHVSDVWLHRLTGFSILVLWFAGKYDSSPLPGGKKE